MAPRKRSAAASSSSSTSSKKPNPSQPSRYGIQHFFERHSQSQATAAPSNPDPFPNAPSIADRLPPPVAAVAEADEVLSQASPEISRNISSKRFKFSPGMLIKQSQDDGGDEITWKISPVNERLRSLASKQLPGAANIFQENSSAQVLPLLKPCSDKQDFSCSVKKLQKCVSSSTTMVSEISSTSSTMASVADQIIYCYNASNGDTKSDTNPKNFKSPFRTPPSLPYESKEAIDGVACNGEPEVLDHRQYRKTLLELLDQVEDVITDETMLDKPRIYSHRDLVDAKPQSENETHPLGQRLINPPSTHVPLDCNSFLVLEVSEKHESSNSLCSQSPVKILRLLNDRNGQERILYLCDEWFYSLIGPGDTVSTVGDFDDEGKCIVDHAKNLVIVHPEILLSGTRVASSFTCPRRAVLDERLKSSEHSSVALTGTMLHQLFQAGLLKELPSREFLEEYATIVIQRNIENLYACGDNEKDIYSKLIDAIPMILNWLKCFKQGEENNGGTVDFGHPDGSKAVSISEVIDIEEMAWAPRYGLKGVIDASVRVNIGSSVTAQHETIMPLEFKTGKGTSGQSAMEHSAQVILYTLLMSERYSKSDIDSGLLYYLRTNQTRGIKVQRSDLIGLIMRRNELATDILKASKTQNLPPMLQNLAMCKSCRHLNFCAIYHKASGGNSESSGLGCLFTDLVGHLNAPHTKFLKHWDSLIDLEAKVSKVNKKEMLDPSRIKGEDSHRSTLSFVLDVKSGFPVGDFSGNGRYIYSFVQHEPHGQSDFSEHESSNLNCSLKCGDYVILSTESGRVPVASGIVCDISQSHLSVSLSRRLRLPGTGPSSVTGNLVQQVWKISKDEVSSSFAIMRFNLIQLFTESLHGTHLRRMIIDLKPPRFDSRGILSQDPAISYIRAQKHLNSDQMRSIQKILAAKDYTLILGMPGTGKTSTMVHAVKALLMRGASILLTSYTNSAIDNLLIKLKLQGVDFVRIGRQEAVHSDIHDHCFGGHTHSVDDIKARMDHVRVVGVTCLGINHPLLANKKFDICIMDEAGQTTLPVSLGPLMLASTFVLVGDHYQLPPLVQSTEARENGMSVSLFCRLSEAHPQAISALQCQYRMCAGIMELSNALIYGNRLRCGSPDIADAKLKFSSMEPITSWQKEILDPNRAVIFVDTDQLPFKEEKDHKSVTNPLEAQIISVVAMELVKKGINGDDIGIITPYNSQASLIRQVLPVSVEVQTIDKYQGRDKDCILVSFVRSVEDSRTCNSSLLGDWHRINVAITRAKKKIIMIGSCKTLSTVPLLKLLIEKVNEQNGIVHISKNEFSHMESDKCFYDRRK